MTENGLLHGTVMLETAQNLRSLGKTLSLTTSMVAAAWLHLQTINYILGVLVLISYLIFSSSFINVETEALKS